MADALRQRGDRYGFMAVADYTISIWLIACAMPIMATARSCITGLLGWPLNEDNQSILPPLNGNLTGLTTNRGGIVGGGVAIKMPFQYAL